MATTPKSYYKQNKEKVQLQNQVNYYKRKCKNQAALQQVTEEKPQEKLPEKAPKAPKAPSPTTVRVKFRVISKVLGLTPSQTIHLNPTDDENSLFWAATPGGKIEMNVTQNGDLLELGEEYYVDFTKVMKREPVMSMGTLFDF